MTKAMTKPETTQLTLDDEDENILSAAKAKAGFERLLKFRKGEYSIQDDVVPLGTEYLAHVAAWTKTWVKFADGKRVERRLYRVAQGEKPPPRKELDDLDEASWPLGYDGNPNDPWTLGRTFSTSSGKQRVTSIASSGARSPQTCQCKRRPSTSLRSTSRLRRRWISQCHQRYLPALTR